MLISGLDAFQLVEYQFLKVNYESMVDWRQQTDYLRCNPQFYGHPRYDFVMFNTTSAVPVCAQLLLVFGCIVAGREHRLALVHTYDEKIPARNRPKKDKDLGLVRIRASDRKQTELIFVDSIIRGIVVAVDDDISHPGDGFIVDVIDTDIFLRIRSLEDRR